MKLSELEYRLKIEFISVPTGSKVRDPCFKISRLFFQEFWYGYGILKITLPKRPRKTRNLKILKSSSKLARAI